MIRRCKTGMRMTQACLLGLLFAGTALYAQEARVRASLQEVETVWVGQQIRLDIELLAPGYFASAASFDLPDPDGMLLMPPTSHPSVSSETIDDLQHSVQRHRLTIWPTRSGEQTIPAITVRFSFKRNPLDKEEVNASVTTETLSFAVQVPPGTDSLGTVISAHDLTADESWDSEPGSDSILAGTAFQRTITFTAPDMPGMVFPPFPAEPIDGLGVYSKQQLQDKDERGALTGVRQQVITYVCEQPGQFTIPAVRFSWFDIEANQLQTIDFPARTLNVITNPAMAAADPVAVASAAADSRRQQGLLVAMLSLLVLVLLATHSPRFRERLARAIYPFRAIHLVPLNPSKLSDSKGAEQ